MKKINIDSDALQEFKVPFEDDYITITLSFRDSYWFMGVNYKEKTINGLKLSSSVLMLQGKNLPFDIIIDSKNLETDPFSVDSFENGLFDFYVLNREEVEEFRGYKVQ